LTFGTFDTPHDVGHLRILEQGQSQIPTLARGGGGVGVYIDSCINKTAYNFSVSLIMIPFFIILNFLNKKESKVICMLEFEIILLQTQSLSIKPFN
jgi:hypothetical protein